MMTREVDDIVLSSVLWSQLREHLLSANAERGRSGCNEQMAFILAAPNASGSRTRLVGHELLHAQRTDLDHQSPSAIGPNGQFVATALTRCRQEGWSLIEVHSHPFDFTPGTTFSSIDWSNDRVKMPKLASMLPEPFYHATMVVGQNSLDAHYYQRVSKAIRSVKQVTIVGSESDNSPVLRYFPSSSSAAASLPPHVMLPSDVRHSRQLPLLGVATQEALSKARVAVVGLGGLGSFVALELAYLGVGHLTLIDPDRIELSNLNRLIGAGPDDVGRHKVDVFRQVIERLAPGVAVTAVAAPLLDCIALNHAKAADLLLGCVDTHGARLSLNHLSIRYLIPLIDAGTGARLGTDSLDARLGGQVQVVAPGVGCLECRGFIHAQRAAYDLAPPEIQEYERARGYGTEEDRPSVIFLNGVVASMQVAETARTLAAASGPTDVAPKLVVYDAKTQRTFPATVSYSPECATCGTHGVVGLADLAPLQAAFQAAPTAGPAFARASLS
ncbi:MAG: ThiF family adenylyltransferase [Pseudonocardiales bacterium]|nr:ThiF family adenylyltransferase [Pseudonocardiales bacterium]